MDKNLLEGNLLRTRLVIHDPQGKRGCKRESATNSIYNGNIRIEREMGEDDSQIQVDVSRSDRGGDDEGVRKLI